MDMEIQAVSSTLSDRLWNHFATNIAFSANTFLNSARHGLHLSQIRTEVSSFELVRYTCRRACKSEAVFFWVYLRTGDTPKFDALYQSSSCFLIIFTGFITIYHHFPMCCHQFPMVPWCHGAHPRSLSPRRAMEILHEESRLDRRRCRGSRLSPQFNII